MEVIKSHDTKRHNDIAAKHFAGEVINNQMSFEEIAALMAQGMTPDWKPQETTMEDWRKHMENRVGYPVKPKGKKPT